MVGATQDGYVEGFPESPEDQVEGSESGRLRQTGLCWSRGIWAACATRRRARGLADREKCK